MDSELLEQIERELATVTSGPWFARENDLIGGHCVMSDDVAPSDSPHCDIADFVRKDDAIFIARAPAHIRAMLPVVKAALEFEAAAGKSTPFSEMTALEIDTLRSLLAAVRAFREGQK
ncbi:MAG TPA: hypothetical protein VN519_06395 [Bryobacteraceae bacterium]|nr:hypothetical protein [Bryobacteraceae bacterium]